MGNDRDPSGDTLDAVSILQEAREAQDRPLATMDESDLKSARDRARETGDTATLRLVKEEMQLREQDTPSAPPSSTSVRQSRPRPTIGGPGSEGTEQQESPGLDADSILQVLQQEQAGQPSGDGSVQVEPEAPQPTQRDTPTARRSSTDRPAGPSAGEEAMEGPEDVPIEGKGTAPSNQLPIWRLRAKKFNDEELTPEQQRRLEEAQRPEESAFQSVLDYLSAPVRGAAEMTASIVEGTSTLRPGAFVDLTDEEKRRFPELARMMEEERGDQRQQIEETIKGESTQARIARSIRSYTEKRLPEVSREERREFAMRTLEGLGSTVPFLLSSLTGPMALSTGAVMGVAGSEGEIIQEARRRRERTEVHAESPDQAAGAEEVQEATGPAAIGGATEALPVMSALSRAVPEPLRKRALQVALGGLEEASQEAFGTVMRNLGAQAFDPERDLLEGVPQAAETGGAVGALLNTIVGLTGGRPGITPDRVQEEEGQAGEAETQSSQPPTDAASVLREVREEQAADAQEGAPEEQRGPDQGAQDEGRQGQQERDQQAEESQEEEMSGQEAEGPPATESTPQTSGEALEQVQDMQEETAPVGAESETASRRRPLADMDRDALENALEEAQETGDQASTSMIRQELRLRERAQTQEEIEDRQDARQVQEEVRQAEETGQAEPASPQQAAEQEASTREEPEPAPEDELFEMLEGATLEELAAIQQTTESPAVREEVQQSRVVQKGDDPTTAAELPDVDPEAVDVRPEIMEAVQAVEETDPEASREAPETTDGPEEVVEQPSTEPDISDASEGETAAASVDVTREEAQDMSVDELADVGEEAAANDNAAQEQVILEELDRRGETETREDLAAQSEGAPEAAQEEEATGSVSDSDADGRQVRRSAQPAREVVTGLPRDEKAILEEIARTSEDPAEIALSWRQAREVEQTREQANDLEQAVEARAPYNTEQYEGEVGSNIQRDEDAVRLRMLSREGRDLDQAAQEISSELGREVSVQELVDTIREVGQGSPDTRTTADRLAERFEEVTGQRITERRADQAIEQAVAEDAQAREAEPVDDTPSAPDEEFGPVTAPFQRTRRLSEVAQLRRRRGERLFRGERADSERVQPRPERTSSDVPTFREMLEDLQDGTGVEIQRSDLPRAAAGMYEAPSGATVVRTPNDVDTAIHEVAHAIDDAHEVMEPWAGEESSPLDDELVPQFSQHGSGAAGQETGAEAGSPTYERAEGFAEWLRAYAVNPEAARERAPETFERYQEAVPEDVREAIEQFGQRLRNYAAAAEAGDPRATLANVETDLDPPGLLDSLKERFDYLFEDRGVGDTWMDRLATELWDEMRIVMKVWDTAQAMKGRDLSELDVDENFRVLARLFNGMDTRTMRYFESGVEDMQGNTVTEGGFDRILEPLDTSSRQQLEQDLGDGIALLVNERVVERATSIREDAQAARQNHEMAEELQEQLDRVESRLETARDRRDKAHRQESYRADQFEGEEVIESLRRRRDALTAVTRNLRRETKRAEQHLRTARRKRENARSALRRAEERWDNHREQMETVTDWERNESTTRELRSEVDRQQERFDQWQEKAMQLEETRDDLRAQIDEAESELEAARERIDQERTHQRRLESAEERIERYEQEVETLTDTRDALREDLREAEARRDEALDRLDYDGRPSGVEEWAERRVERLAGTGGGLFSDEEVALRYLERLQEDPDRADRLQAFARRYREWADALLQRLRDAGILSQEQIDGIRERNEYYAAFNRVEGQEEAFVMDNVNSEAAQSVGGLASSDQVIHRFKGSTRTMRNPLVSLIGQTHAVVTETERNQVLQAFVNPFRSERGMYEGDVMDLGRIARKATSEDDRTIEVKVDGETEYWQLHPELYETMKNIDGVEQQSGFIRTIQQVIRFSRNLITYSPAFVTRQLFRDPQEVAIKTESGFKPWENLTYLTDRESREQFIEDVAQLESAGGAQFGWHVRGREGYYEQLRRTIEDLAGDDGTIITSFQNLLDTYKRLVEKSEIASRVGDFRRRYEQLLEDGMEEYDARRKAAYETRNLMDFAQGGRAIKQLNKFIPFLNAAVQGMRTAMRAGRENPSGLAWRFLKYGLTAEVGAYVWNTLAGGDDGLERWRQEPAYLKDFFYTFHIPGAEWTTIRIPKTYEFGLLSSMVVRSAEKGLSMATDGEQGDPNAFSGVGRSAKTAFMPLDPAAVASSPGLSLLNVQANWDPFRQRHIVSPYEAKLDLDLREGDQYASRLGQGLQTVGMKTLGSRFAMDARKWDYLIQSLAGGSGRLLTTASDIGRTDQAGREFWMDASGLFVHPPVYGSRDVQFVLDYAERRGQTSHPAIERVENLVDATYEADDAETRRARAEELWEYARQVREAIEEGQLREQ